MRSSENNKLIAALTIAISLLAGCADTDGRVNENTHALSAPLFGAAAGLSVGSAIGGTGPQIGLSSTGAIGGFAAAPFLARRDVVYFDKAVDVAAAAKPGVPVKWENPHTGTTGVMTRLKDVEISIFLLCRELRSNVTTKKARTAEQIIVCTDDYGPWYIHSSQILENRPIS